MFITQCYKYKYNEIVYVGGNPPQDVEILETMDILNAEEGFELVRKSDNENVGINIWLKDGDTEDNYTEIVIPEEESD